jgi:hypothetical protein
MPNYCHNCLIVKGQNVKRKMEKFIAVDEDCDMFIDLEQIIPATDRDKYASREHIWGSRTNTFSLKIIDYGDSEDIVNYKYDTVYNPVTPALVRLSELLPDLEFYSYYIENGIGFSGYDYIVKGKINQTGYYKRKDNCYHTDEDMGLYTLFRLAFDFNNIF